MIDVQGGAKSTIERVFDPVTGLVTETTTSSVASPVVAESFRGLETRRTTDGESVVSAYDAFGRCIGKARCHQHAATQMPFESYVYSPVGDLVEKHTFTNEAETIVERYAYDMFGRRIETIDALGESTHTAYDAVGNVLAEWGATYPVRYAYDTQGRRTRLATTRDGVAWDETRWTYDATTGLCTAKRYADGSVVGYAYTPDGLLLRTTYAGGRWIENVYDDQRRLVGTFSSDGVNDVVLRRDAFGCETSSSNAVASYDYVLDRGGIATNETAAVGTLSRTLRRTVDDQGRLASLGGNGGFATQTINYRTDGRIGRIVTDDVAVDYAYSADGYDTGYTLAVTGGATFTRTLTRDPCRRDLVLTVTNSIGGSSQGFAYTYDALARPVTRNDDAFAYNSRSEVAAATIGGNHEAHVYDNIGNSTFAAFNSVTNRYESNGLNQYTTINQSNNLNNPNNRTIRTIEHSLVRHRRQPRSRSSFRLRL